MITDIIPNQTHLLRILTIIMVEKYIKKWKKLKMILKNTKINKNKIDFKQFLLFQHLIRVITKILDSNFIKHHNQFN